MNKLLGLAGIFLLGFGTGCIVAAIGKETLVELDKEKEENLGFWDEEIARDFDIRYEDDLK